MRTLPFLATALVLSALAAQAQVQEKKLIDRLLEPDLSLQNSAQEKKFTPVGSTATKKARTKTFYAAERPREKQFGGTRSFFTKIFGTRRSRYNDAQAKLETRSEIATPQIPASASAYASVRPALPVNQTYAVSEFPGTRPFLVRGKSQKSLSALDRPLTIDQVRELLNKNK